MTCASLLVPPFSPAAPRSITTDIWRKKEVGDRTRNGNARGIEYAFRAQISVPLAPFQHEKTRSAGLKGIEHMSQQQRALQQNNQDCLNLLLSRISGKWFLLFLGVSPPSDLPDSPTPRSFPPPTSRHSWLSSSRALCLWLEPPTHKLQSRAF